jgi:hypothetical protein
MCRLPPAGLSATASDRGRSSTGHRHVQHRVNPLSPRSPASSATGQASPTTSISIPATYAATPAEPTFSNGSPAKHRVNRCSAPGHPLFTTGSPRRSPTGHARSLPGHLCSPTGHPVSPKPLSQPRRTPQTARNAPPGTPSPPLEDSLPSLSVAAHHRTPPQPAPRKTPRHHAILRRPATDGPKQLRPCRSPAGPRFARSTSSGCWTRTNDQAVNSRLLYRLS